ncbi:MAG TPA: GNAT family N-acetyltransferase [Puia sp.]
MHTGFSPFPELKTPRLLLRRLSESDDREILFLRSDPGINKFISRQRTKSREEARDFILRINKDISEERSFYWVITILGSPKLIGVICLWNFDENRRVAELGYELMPAFQKQGIMHEAVSSVLDYAFLQISLDRIEAFTHKKNKNSIRLLKKSGFSPVPERTDADNSSNIIFSLGRNEFK